MAIANFFHHSLIRKYISIFGTIFNQMTIERFNEENERVQRMPVPIHYGPYQKFLSRIVQDKGLDKKTQMTMPRMSFEITSMNFAAERNIPALGKIKAENGTIWVPAPYDINFTLSIMVEYQEDGAQIVEQILPFFKPDYSVTAELVEGSQPIDLYFNLDSISQDDVYEGQYEQRQSIIWTLSFTMKGGFFYGPVRSQSVIKFVDIETNYGKVTTQPGLTSTGEPTKDVNESIPWMEIEKDDNWAFITTIEENLNE